MPKITKNERGTWGFVVDLGNDPATGKRRQARRSGFRTKKEAEEELRRLQNEADKGIVVKKREGNVTFEEFSQDWLEHYTATAGVRLSTIKGRRSYLNTVNKMIGGVKLENINKAMYDKFLKNLFEQYVPETAKHMNAVASMVLNYAVACGLIARNPALAATKPRKAVTLDDVPEDIEEKYLNRAEVERLLNAARQNGDFQNYVIFHTLIFSGLRIGELLALEFKHLEQSNVLKVRQTISTALSSGTVVLQPPKSAAGIRDVELDKTTAELLHQQIIEKKKQRLAVGSGWYTEHNFIFTAPLKPGKPCVHPTVSLVFQKLLKNAGITKKITLHSLRHTHASLLAESGASLEQIQARLGHSSDKTTREIYLHITKDSSALMMENFSRFMQM